MDAEEWLDDWVDANLVGQSGEDADDIARQVALCLKDARAAGISEADLLNVAAGDLEEYLRHEQHEIDQAARS